MVLTTSRYDLLDNRNLSVDNRSNKETKLTVATRWNSPYATSAEYSCLSTAYSL
jgi:hypothetical protein